MESGALRRMVTYLTEINESELGESDTNMARFEGVFTPAQVMSSIMPTMKEPLDRRAQKVIERLERLESGLGK